MVAQGLPWSPNGGTVVATVIVQCTLLVAQRRHKGGRSLAQIDGKICSRTHLLPGDHWSTTVPPFCNHGNDCASLLPPLSHLRATNLLGDLCATFVRLFWTCSKIYGDNGVHGDVWTSCVPPSNDLANHSASFEPPAATWQILWSHKGGTKVAILCKGGITQVWTFRLAWGLALIKNLRFRGILPGCSLKSILVLRYCRGKVCGAEPIRYLRFW